MGRLRYERVGQNDAWTCGKLQRNATVVEEMNSIGVQRGAAHPLLEMKLGRRG